MCYLPLRLLNWKITCIEAARRRIQEKDARLEPALQHLHHEIAAAMHAGPYSVTFKKLIPPSGDRHDYLSLEDCGSLTPPRTPPAASHLDRLGLQAMSKAVQTLSLARALLGEAKYAAHAASLLHTWFLDPATRMNPHLQYAHTVPGEPIGCEEGLKETACLIPLLDCSLLLLGSHRWTQREHEALVTWFAEFLAWLREGDFGQKATLRSDSLGTWYDAQVAAYAVFTGDDEVARRAIHRAAMRLDQQFTREGRPRLDQCISYCCYNMHGLYTLARVGEAVGMDLWRHETARGRSLLKATHYLAPYADFGRGWSQEGIESLLTELCEPASHSTRAKLAGLLRQAELAWPGEGFSAWFRKLPQDLTLTHRCRLVWATPRRAHDDSIVALDDSDAAGDSSDTSLSGYEVA